MGFGKLSSVYFEHVRHAETCFKQSIFSLACKAIVCAQVPIQSQLRQLNSVRTNHRIALNHWLNIYDFESRKHKSFNTSTQFYKKNEATTNIADPKKSFKWRRFGIFDS